MFINQGLCGGDLRGLHLARGSSPNPGLLPFVSNQIKEIKEEGDHAIPLPCCKFPERELSRAEGGCQRHTGAQGGAEGATERRHIPRPKFHSGANLSLSESTELVSGSRIRQHLSESALD